MFYIMIVWCVEWKGYSSGSDSTVSPSVDSDSSSSVAACIGSLSTLGATTVAITKSLSVIVGKTFSGSFTEDILRLVFISVLS